MSDNVPLFPTSLVFLSAGTSAITLYMSYKTKKPYETLSPIEKTWREIMSFVGITFTTTSILQSTVLFITNVLRIGQPYINFVNGIGYMFMPGISAYLCEKRYKTEEQQQQLQQQPEQSWKQTLKTLFNNRYLWLSLIVMPVACTLSGLASLLIPGVKFSPSGNYVLEFMRHGNQISEEMINSARTALEIRNAHLTMNLSIGVIVSAFLGGFVNFIPCYGEEKGWRGYLLPRFKKLGYSFWKRSILTGFIWGIWHIPIIICGHNYPFHPLQGSMLFIIITMLFSPYITLISENLMPSHPAATAALIHGTINASAGNALTFLEGGTDLTNGPTGIAGCGVLALLNVLIYAASQLQWISI
eukprot:TRINITY_DN7665_c0_g1_i1.p1 TRINITY_DN7665_c0_g1~~TRINITY_DN7665_c0_g1_i1.p1  ORF type:complete len:385 (+),score=42.19 TRINITY_DN7665_c0_g1_i1:84-1157(+)